MTRSTPPLPVPTVEILWLYQADGLLPWDIAQRLGISQGTVQGVLKEWELINEPTLWDLKQRRNEKIVHLRCDQRWSVKAIARHVQVCVTTVRTVLKAHQIQPTHPVPSPC